MKSEDLINAFRNGLVKGTSNSMIILDNILFSYGSHFPLLIRLESDEGYKFILNYTRYSTTTSKQQTYCRRICGDDIISEKPLADMMKLKNSNIKNVTELVADSL